MCGISVTHGAQSQNIRSTRQHAVGEKDRPELRAGTGSGIYHRVFRRRISTFFRGDRSGRSRIHHRQHFSARHQPDGTPFALRCGKRASAKHITVVMPYFGWARQDRKDKSRVPIGAKLIANLLRSAGATRIMTMDLHADQIQGFFEMPVDHLFVSSLFVPHIQQQNMEKLTIGSPDVGGSKRITTTPRSLAVKWLFATKSERRPT